MILWILGTIQKTVKMDNYNSICQIGKGACGAVYLVRNQDTKKLFALKKIQLDESKKTRTKEAVLREANILSELKHPHIVAYHDSFFEKVGEHEFLCIIQDYCDGGTLDDIISDAMNKKQYLKESRVMEWFIQITLAVRYMHSKKVLHRDLKTQNVFLNKSATLCKLGDFGIAKSMDTTLDVANTCVGTPCYLSPEMCQDIPYSSKSDVWALGCLLYEMLSQQPAFDAQNLVSLFYKIVKGEYNPVPDFYSDNMKELIATILTKDPEIRPSARGVLALSFVKQELHRFIEEKEFIKQNHKLPTRQGSRPYSTSTLASRSQIFDAAKGNALIIDDINAKRALSCRPNIVNRNRERSLASAKPKKSGRVSTIPEESEDADKSLRNSHNAIRLAKIRETQTPEPAKSEPISQTTKPRPHTGPRPESASKNELIIKREKPLETLPKGVKNKNIEDVGETQRAASSESKKSRRDSDEKLVSPSLSDLREDFDDNDIVNNNSDKVSEKGDEDVPRRSKILEPTRTPRIQTPNALVIEEVEEVTVNKVPEIVTPPYVDETPSPTKSHVIGQPKRNAKTEGVTLVIQPETPKPNSANVLSHRRKTSSRVSSIKSSARGNRKESSKRRGSEQRSRMSAASRGNRSSVRPGTRDSMLSVPYDPSIEYYSDDFDDSSGSDFDEDIPEVYEYGSTRSYSFSTTYEIPEIEEDLPNGEVADDDDYLNDFDEDFDEIEEELEQLDEVLLMAREACDNIDIPSEAEETVVYENDKRPDTSRLIRKTCVEQLGKDKYDKVKKYVENNEDGDITMNKLEKIVGKENAKTAFVISEHFKSNKKKKKT